MSFRPRIYPKNEEELNAWRQLLENASKVGILQYLDNGERKTITETSEGLQYDLAETTISTKEQLVKACNIDLSKWEITSFRVSTWQQKEGGKQLYSVRCCLKPRVSLDAELVLKAIETGLKNQIRPEKKPFIPTCENVAIINIFDAHIDKVTRAIETGQEADIKQKVSDFWVAFEYLLMQAGAPELIVFPIGNDFFNVNDSRNTTKKGTPQDSYISFIDAFEIGLNLLLQCIDAAATVAPVHIPIIAGNHAEDLEYILGCVINTVYRNNKHITVNYNRQYRKYLEYGVNLFMFAHGDRLKNKIAQIPQIMAEEEPQKWANAKQRYAIFGDIHHEQTHDLRGVKAMFLRSMSYSDKWHHSEGYISKRTAYLHVFSKCGKYTSTETINF
jgi:hypothetical protein